MFAIYVMRELRGRRRQAVVTALGLAVGAGLLITASAASAGVTDAYDVVLHALAQRPGQASAAAGSLRLYLNLTRGLGTVTSIAAIIAAFGQAIVFTMTAVLRRVREFGTLRALGWRSRRIIGQVMGEAVAMGIVGGAVGVGLGLAGAELVAKLTPPLSATVGQVTGSATPGGPQHFGAGGFPGGFRGSGLPGSGFRRAAADAAHTVAVHLIPAVSTGIIVLAVVLAIAGGIIAGSFGGWRAARLRPAAALTKVA